MPIIDCEITILMHVAANLDGESVSKILALNPNIDARDSLGRTALHFACRAGNLDTCSLIVDHDDVDVDAVTHSGVTPLMCAVESGNI